MTKSVFRAFDEILCKELTISFQVFSTDPGGTQHLEPCGIYIDGVHVLLIVLPVSGIDI